MDFSFVGTHTPKKWETWNRDSVVVDDEGLVRVRADRPSYVTPESVLADQRFRAIDLDVDGCGNLFVLGETADEAGETVGVVYRWNRGDGRLRRLECVDENGRGFEAPTAIAVTNDSIFVAEGRGVGGRIHAFSKYLQQRRWVETDAYEDPVAFARSGDTVFVVDASLGVLAELRRGGAREDLRTGLTTPVDVTVDPSGTVYVLEAAAPDPVVRVLDPATEDPGEDRTVTVEEFDPVCIEAVGDGELLAGVDTTSDDRVLFRYRIGDDTENGSPVERVVSFRRPCSTLLVHRPGGTVGEGHLYAIEAGTGRLYALDEVLRYRRNGRTGRFDGRAWARLDAASPETQWHRVTAGVRLAGAGTQVRLAFFATDDEDLTLSGSSPEWRDLGTPDPEDALLPEAVGRYLWVRLELVGTEYDSPRVDSFRAYFPRRSYLRYLPAIYREDEASAAFLERFLSIFESTNVGIEERIESVTKFLDPEGIPTPYLAWLGEWLALDTDERWPEAATRKLLSRAPELFRMRGTRAGLLAVLEIYFEFAEARTGAWAAALEREREAVDERAASGALTEAEARELKERLGRDVVVLTDADLDCVEDEAVLEGYRTLVSCPRCALVLVHPSVTPDGVRAVERVVDAQTPAHAVVRVVQLQPWVQLGGNAYLGVNSALPKRELVVETGRLGKDSVLGRRERTGQLELVSKLGEDAVIS